MKNTRARAIIDGNKVANSFATMKRNERLLLRKAKRVLPSSIHCSHKVAKCYSIRVH